jgi:N-acetylmuramic acid 6-phosphate etherase
MTDLVAGNQKLRGRQIRMLAQATGADHETCAAALRGAAGESKVALVMLLSAAPTPDARHALRSSGGLVREALRILSNRTPTPH